MNLHCGCYTTLVTQQLILTLHTVSPVLQSRSLPTGKLSSSVALQTVLHTRFAAPCANGSSDDASTSFIVTYGTMATGPPITCGVPHTGAVGLSVTTIPIVILRVARMTSVTSWYLQSKCHCFRHTTHDDYNQRHLSTALSNLQYCMPLTDLLLALQQ